MKKNIGDFYTVFLINDMNLDEKPETGRHEKTGTRNSQFSKTGTFIGTGNLIPEKTGTFPETGIRNRKYCS